MEVKPFKALPENEFLSNLANPKCCTLVALDMGYSSRKSSTGKTCGVCGTDLKEDNFHFGTAINQILLFIRGHVDNQVILVIEAPLSTAHKMNGLPQIRGSFEKHHPWWCRAGAETHLGAQRFLRQLWKCLKEEGLRAAMPINLVEAYLPRNKSIPEHALVAKFIINHFFNDNFPSVIAGNGWDPILPELVSGIPIIRNFAPAAD